MIKYLYKPYKSYLANKTAAIVVNAYQWLPILLHTLFVKPKEYKYTVSLCLIFKNEAKHLREWIEYHHMIGVDHFYLYNNFSEDNYKEVLAPYIQAELVTLTEYPYQYAQRKAYEDCYNRFKTESHWIGYIDTDEFINLIAWNNLKDMLKHYQHVPSLYLNWRMFGTSGYLKDDDSLVIERYTAAWPYLVDHGKSFINNNYHFHRFGCHMDTAKFLGIKLFAVNLQKFAVPYMDILFAFNLENKAYINHYWSKSYDEYSYKAYAKGDADSPDCEKRRKNPDNFPTFELQNCTQDHSIQRWLCMLKLRLNK